MKNRSKNSSDERASRVNMASEFFVASECYRRGWIPSVVIGNAKCCDLHVSFGNRDPKIIEVKAKSVKNGSWSMDKPKAGLKNTIYVLVDYRGQFENHIERPKATKLPKHWRPKCYIIPSREIRKHWDSKASYNGGIRLSKIRHIKKYHEKWSNIFADGLEDGPPPVSRSARKAQF